MRSAFGPKSCRLSARISVVRRITIASCSLRMLSMAACSLSRSAMTPSRSKVRAESNAFNCSFSAQYLQGLSHASPFYTMSWKVSRHFPKYL
jgi:hypothetical protein